MGTISLQGLSVQAMEDSQRDAKRIKLDDSFTMSSFKDSSAEESELNIDSDGKLEIKFSKFKQIIDNEQGSTHWRDICTKVRILSLDVDESSKDEKFNDDEFRAMGNMIKLESIRISENSEVYRSREDVLYSKNLKILYFCPPHIRRKSIITFKYGTEIVVWQSIRRAEEVCGNPIEVVVANIKNKRYENKLDQATCKKDVWFLPSEEVNCEKKNEDNYYITIRGVDTACEYDVLFSPSTKSNLEKEKKFYEEHSSTLFKTISERLSSSCPVDAKFPFSTSLGEEVNCEKKEDDYHITIRGVDTTYEYDACVLPSLVSLPPAESKLEKEKEFYEEHSSTLFKTISERLSSSCPVDAKFPFITSLGEVVNCEKKRENNYHITISGVDTAYEYDACVLPSLAPHSPSAESKLKKEKEYHEYRKKSYLSLQKYSLTPFKTLSERLSCIPCCIGKKFSFSTPFGEVDCEKKGEDNYYISVNGMRRSTTTYNNMVEVIKNAIERNGEKDDCLAGIRKRKIINAIYEYISQPDNPNIRTFNDFSKFSKQKCKKIEGIELTEYERKVLAAFSAILMLSEPARNHVGGKLERAALREWIGHIKRKDKISDFIKLCLKLHSEITGSIAKESENEMLQHELKMEKIDENTGSVDKIFDNKRFKGGDKLKVPYQMSLKDGKDYVERFINGELHSELRKEAFEFLNRSISPVEDADADRVYQSK